MRTLTLMLILALLAGCDDDMIVRGRRDTGVHADSGLGGPLPLRPGMTFTYEGRLTYRSDAVAEENSIYELTVTIGTVDDQGAEGESSLTFTAAGRNLLDDDFALTSEFDLWVARLGPSQDTDVVETGVVDELLTDPPAIPAPPSPPPKRVPQAGTFFIDVRAIDRIGAEFTESHQGLGPQLIAPETSGNGNWAFAFEGPDPSVFYFNNKTRSMRIEYHPDGWLSRIDERVGTSTAPPFADARLILKSGP